VSGRALCLVREALHYRRDAFLSGLRAAGFKVVPTLKTPGPGDALVIWNRYGWYAAEANRFEAAGARVVVAENGYLGKAWCGGNWYALSIGHHAGAGKWRIGGPERWDALGVELAPWRSGDEIVVLGQRGIGEPGIAAPDRWAERARRRFGGRIRPHPADKSVAAVPLAGDLANAKAVVTWHSGAALQALLLGVPVFYEFDRWIGAPAARHVSKFGEPLRDDAARLSMFRRLAWAQWQLEEIRSGEAFQGLFGSD